MNLIFDTETTGLADFRLPQVHLAHPRMVSLAAILTDTDGAEISMMSAIIYPEMAIPKQASAIHGITTERARQCGVPLVCALSMFCQMAAKADALVAHNIEFDLRIIRTELYRVSRFDRLKDMMPFCTMHASKPICKIPGKRGHKWPSLDEAHRHFFSEGFSGAHSALEDARACARVYQAIQSHQHPAIEQGELFEAPPTIHPEDAIYE